MEYNIKVRIDGNDADLQLESSGVPVCGWNGDFDSIPIGLYQLICMMQGVI
jgi:hypothetical protein